MYNKHFYWYIVITYLCIRFSFTKKFFYKTIYSSVRLLLVRAWFYGISTSKVLLLILWHRIAAWCWRMCYTISFFQRLSRVCFFHWPLSFLIVSLTLVEMRYKRQIFSKVQQVYSKVYISSPWGFFKIMIREVLLN